jgi:hypothetical protein
MVFYGREDLCICQGLCINQPQYWYRRAADDCDITGSILLQLVLELAEQHVGGSSMWLSILSLQ